MMQWLLSTISLTSLIRDATSCGAFWFMARQVAYSDKKPPRDGSPTPGGGGGGRTPLELGGRMQVSMKGMNVMAQSALPAGARLGQPFAEGNE